VNTEPSSQREDSPCVHICLMDYAQGLCIGCHRTLDEITYWATYSPARKREVLAALEIRRAAASTNP
jgi:predicted Fe-S protein YdhL (DUF1289 family)